MVKWPVGKATGNYPRPGMLEKKTVFTFSLPLNPQYKSFNGKTVVLQIMDLVNLKNELRHLLVIAQQLEPYIRSISSLMERIQPQVCMKISFSFCQMKDRMRTKLRIKILGGSRTRGGR